MTIITVDRKKKHQRIRLEDGTEGIAKRIEKHTLLFEFENDLHPAFHCSNRLRNGDVVTVPSTEGEEQFQLNFD